MNKLRIIVLLAVMMLVLMSTGMVNAQREGPKVTPPTPKMVTEIMGTRGAALLQYYPQYATLTIPVTNEVRYILHHNPLTAKMIEEINRTRGAALVYLTNWNK